MHADDIDISADGRHAYSAELAARRLRITVSPDVLQTLGLGAAEEPLFVRRTLEQLPLDELGRLGDEVDLQEIGQLVPGYPELILARMRT